MKIHPVKNQTLNVTAETMDIGMTGIDYLGAKEVQFIEISNTHSKFGATFRVECNGKEMEVSEHFFVPTK